VTLGIQNIAMGFPSRRISPSELGFGKDEAYFASVSGAKNLYRTAAGEFALDLCERAAKNLLADNPEALENVQAILVVTLPTEPTVAPISARLQAKLGLPASVFCLDLTLSCVGFLQGSSLLLDMMAARGWKKAVLFDVETLSKIIAKNDQALQLVMSDAAAVTLFSENSRMQFRNFEIGVDGTLAGILDTRDGTMFMDGPKLYETVIRKLPVSFRSALAKFGYKKEQIHFFAFHQGSRRVLDKLIQELELDRATLLEGIGEFGNMGSCAIPHLLMGLLNENHETDKLVYCTAFGAGFQWAHSIVHLLGKK
jgi:3-oxoacyl-[acyl-carrier-protein] synthase-3